MPVSRAGWEEQTGEKRLSSFERSKRDRAKPDNRYAAKPKASEPKASAKKVPYAGEGQLKKAISTILNKNADTQRRIKEEAGL